MECILLTARLPKDQQVTLGHMYRVLGPYDGPVPDAIPPADRAAIRACFTSGTIGASASLIEALPNLGLIACWGSGYEGVDLDAARTRGIKVTHSPGSNAASVADMAMALMLASIRRLAE
ncbi:MAG TPA: 2-hydroxyacid dehydrogenase, partial [Beijerinckiaceae bacterium]|nr:2-hydroxyacid dehydrogenase [Beijerinckiaceae bacterium]